MTTLERQVVSVTAPPVRRAPHHADRRSARGSDRRSTRRRLHIIIAIAALEGALAPGSPTGTAPADVLWSALIAATVTAAASRSRRAPTLWLAGVATVASVGTWWLLAGTGSLFVAAGGASQRARSRVRGALVGAVAVQVLLRLPDLGVPRASAVIAVVAVAPVLWSGYDRSPSTVRRSVRRLVAGAAMVVVVSSVVAGVAAFSARSQMERGVEGATAGFALIREGEPGPAALQFHRASDAFGAAAARLEAPWMWPARAIPGLGPHTRALVTVASSGHDLMARAADQAEQAPYQELRATAGQVDLDRVRSMQAPVRETVNELEGARTQLQDVRSPWLVPPVARPMQELRDEVDGALGEAQIASDVLAVAPALLGAEGDRQYLMLFTSPAESRGLGGFVGAYGLLTARGGEVDLTTSGSVDELTNAPTAAGRSIEGPDAVELTRRYGRFGPAHYAQNLTVSPDLETDARMARSFYEQTTGVGVDGVLVVDPYALAALLQLVGPVQIDGLSHPLTAENTAEFLLHDQYLVDDGRAARQDRLEDVAEATFDALTSRNLPGPQALERALGGVVEQKRLAFFPFDDEGLGLFDRLGATSRFSQRHDGDLLSVRSTNAIGSKIDYFLHRSLRYSVAVDPARGRVEATLTVTLRNEAPAAGLPDNVIGDAGNDAPERPLGTSEQYLSFYTPLEATGITVDGSPGGLEEQAELGGRVYSLLLTIPPGGERTVVLLLAGDLEQADRYELDLVSQPLVNVDEIDVAVHAAGGRWHLDGASGLDVRAGEATHAGQLVTDEHFTASFGT